MNTPAALLQTYSIKKVRDAGVDHFLPSVVAY